MGRGFEPDGFGSWIWYLDASPILPQLTEAGLLRYLTPIEVHETFFRATADLAIIPYLEGHPKFAMGSLHYLHPDVGENRRDFRSYRGTFGKGSLQIVVDEKTGNLYADLDRFSPYQDLVNWFGHAFGEVVPNWLRKRL